MSTPTRKDSRRILVSADTAASQAFSRRQIFRELDLLKPSLIIHGSKGRITDYLKQYIKARNIMSMEFDTLQEEAITTGRPGLMVIFTGNHNPKSTDDAVAAARRQGCPTLLIAQTNHQTAPTFGR